MLFAEQPARLGSRPGQLAEPNVLGSETRGADQRSFALAVLIEVEISASLNERVDEGQFLTFLAERH